MQTEQLIKGLKAKFELSRIVFWYDDEQSFTNEIVELSSVDTLSQISILEMNNESAFEVKKRIELDYPDTKFLLYFPSVEPEIDRDWLLDISLYSQRFYADSSSILLNELGITKLSLRPHLAKRKSFFANKKRTAAFKRLLSNNMLTEDESEFSIDLKMIAVLCDADNSLISEILLHIFNDYAVQQESSSNLDYLTIIKKYGLAESFWKSIEQEYDYHHSSTQDQSKETEISDLLLSFYCTDLYTQIDITEPKGKQWLSANVIGTSTGKARVSTLFSDWRDSRRYSDSYLIIAKGLESSLEVSRNISEYSVNSLLDCYTFEVVEQEIIRKLVTDLLDDKRLSPSFELSKNEFNLIISKRLEGFWCHSNPYYAEIYQALKASRELFELRKTYTDGFNYKTSSEMYKAYTTDLFKFDQNYRLFNEYARHLHAKGADILRHISDAIEDLYVNWYLNELSLAWDRLLTKEDLLNHWRIDDVLLQTNFYQNKVQLTLSNTPIKRVFVVISDAFRYEVAEELCHQLNLGKRFKAEIDSHLSVLPSYTQLGIAALLPHKTLEYKTDKGSAVWVDGKSSAGLENRNAILSNVNGLAVTSKELLAWSNDEGRKKIANTEVVYIYHNTIDAIGDKAETEDKTFSACRTAIEELNDLVGRVVNRLNGSRLFITADHGFLFRQKAMEKTDKTELLIKPANAFETKKRYILGQNIPLHDNCWKGEVSNTAKSQCNTEFLLPRGVNRFHFVGGARFVHGGAMLQEVCVPMISVSGLRDKRAEQHAKKKVDVVVVGAHIKIVNNIDKIRFIQSDPVGKQFIPRKLKVVIVDENRNAVSSEESLIFNSQSSSMDERSQEGTIKLVGSDFDRRTDYKLLLIDADNNTEYAQYTVTIDLAIQDDFF